MAHIAGRPAPAEGRSFPSWRPRLPLELRVSSALFARGSSPSLPRAFRPLDRSRERPWPHRFGTRATPRSPPSACWCGGRWDGSPWAQASSPAARSSRCTSSSSCPPSPAERRVACAPCPRSSASSSPAACSATSPSSAPPSAPPSTPYRPLPREPPPSASYSPAPVSPWTSPPCGASAGPSPGSRSRPPSSRRASLRSSPPPRSDSQPHTPSPSASSWPAYPPPWSYPPC